MEEFSEIAEAGNEEVDGDKVAHPQLYIKPASGPTNPGISGS